MLGANNAETGDRHNRQIEPVSVDEHQRADGEAADGPPPTQQTRRAGKSPVRQHGKRKPAEK